MTNPSLFEVPTPAEQSDLDALRKWVLSKAEPNQMVTVAGKLNLIQQLLNTAAVTASDSWKLAALGLLFGDALHQAFEGRLKWVIAEDDQGVSPALQWKSTDLLVFPTSAIRTRVQQGEAVDVHVIFADYSSLFPFRTR